MKGKRPDFPVVLLLLWLVLYACSGGGGTWVADYEVPPAQRGGSAVHGWPPVTVTTPVVVSRGPVGDTPSTVIIDINTIITDNFKGIGVEFDPYAPGLPIDWDMITSRLDFLKPAFVRTMVETWNYVLSDNGYAVIDDQQPVYRWNNPSMLEAYKVLDYCQKNGIDVVWGDWGDWFGNLTEKTYANTMWSMAIGEAVNHLVNKKGYDCVKRYNLGNEPNGDWSQCNGDFKCYHDGVQNMKAELGRRKLGDMVSMSGPSIFGWTGNDEIFAGWLQQTTQNLWKQLSSYDIHWYPSSGDVANGLVESTIRAFRQIINTSDPQGSTKDFFILESGLIDDKTHCDRQPHIAEFQYGVWMADLAAQAIRGGVSGISAWDLDDASHPSCCDDAGPGPCYKEWGMWSSVAVDKGMRPWFYPWSLLSRLFPKGSQVVSAGPNPVAHGVRVLAMKKPNADKYDLSVMIVNNADSGIGTITIKIPNAGKATLNQYNYFEIDRTVDGQGFPAVKTVLTNVDIAEGVQVNIPSSGVVFLTTLSAGDG